ncbi:subtilisin-like protease SBT4.3 [Artemisia annua]|uniref:Subtilisin-like protease SBT4.3 n=1 Tax=Artemisia annua TaxID=35608 RepID=A0A2U1QPC7_ARTAN|nr:subtilisin-like protease SBT4.3 [Artemisia annua]
MGCRDGLDKWLPRPVIVASHEATTLLYIFFMESLPEGDYSPSVHHSKIIRDIVDPRFAKKSLQRSFGRSFDGFAAYVTEAEMLKLKRLPGVESVILDQKLKPQTTRSMDYIHLSDGIARNPGAGSDFTIGVIDSGISPESQSFKDDGFGPVPAKWKGECRGGADFPCNKKIIGARYYNIDGLSFSARDYTGHGTHVASIAAGNYVKGASYYGIAEGVAKGGVPSARLAVYKVCDEHCHTTDILSAFDDAIADGVDVISVSIAYSDQLNHAVDVPEDPIAIGSLHALKRNILTSAAAGNDGPALGSIRNFAPWMITAGASDIDRRILVKVLLGNGTILVGQGVNAFPSSYGESPLVRGKEVTSICSETDARNCLPRCIDSSLVEKKVVLCDMVPSFKDINTTGVGFIIPNYQEHNVSSVKPYTVVALSEDNLNFVRSYHTHNTDPKVQILKSEAVYDSDARHVATFSGRGPSRFMPEIIKPDVTAPGVEILAAFSPMASPSGFPYDNRSVEYNILSGTSMACPHVTAAVVYVKSQHPDWSPSAIKSALMTTAWKFFDGTHPEAEFAYGSGHINPLMAADPGLVYETPIEEYLKLWCSLSRTTGSSTATNANCSNESAAREMNYPSMAALLDTQSFVVSFPRTVTNVGHANSTYISSIDGDLSNMHISVEPSTLQFTALNQNLSFVVTVRGKRMKPLTTRRASLVWTDGFHKVHSPLVLYRENATSGGERAVTPRWPCTLIRKALLFQYDDVAFYVELALSCLERAKTCAVFMGHSQAWFYVMIVEAGILLDG